MKFSSSTCLKTKVKRGLLFCLILSIQFIAGVKASGQSSVLNIDYLKNLAKNTSIPTNAFNGLLFSSDIFTKYFTQNNGDNSTLSISCPGDKTLSACTTVIGSYVAEAVVNSSCALNNIVVVQTPVAGTPIAIGATVVVTLTVTDGCANTASCSFNVTRPPFITASGPTTFCSGGSVTLTASPGVTYAWKKSGVATGTGLQTLTVTASGSYTVTVTDGSNCTQISPAVTVTVNALPALVMASASPNTICAGAPSTLTAAGTGGLTYTWTAGGNFVGTGSPLIATPTTTTNYTLTATNANGCSKTATASITVNKAPVLTCPANILVNNAANQCGSAVIYPAATVTGTPTPTVNYSVASGSFFQVGTTTVTVTANNTCGTTSCSFTVTVKDNQAPVITCPAALTVSADPGLCGAYITTSGGGGINNKIAPHGKGAKNNDLSFSRAVAASSITPTVTDNCSTTTPVGTRSDGLAMSALFPVGTTIITWTVSDASGNTASCTQQVTVTDDESPVINNLPTNIIASNAINTCGTVVSWTPPTVSDNCGAAMTSNHTPGETFPVGTTTVTYTATDVHSHTTTSSFTVTVNDTQAPVLTGVPSDLTVECDAVPVAGTVTASDNCTQNIPVQFSEVQTNGSCPSSYILTRKWTATDVAGNMTTGTQVITVQDTHAPVLSAAPADITVECDAVPAAATLTATDNCDAAPVVTFNEVHTNGTCPSSYTLTRIWTATDACGNSSSKTQIITVRDTQAPVLSAAPVDVTVECDAVPAATTLTATDNCDAAPVVTFNEVHTNGTCPSSYTLTRTWTATDACGNSSFKTQAITVQDTQAPVLTVPASITVNNDLTQCGAVVNYTAATATDNCGTAAITYSKASGTLFAIGTTTVTVTATDNCGNQTVKTFDVTVNDTEEPSIICPTAVVVNNTLGQCGTNVTLASPQTSDNCGVATVVNDHASPFFSIGVTTVTWTVTDVHGNVNTCTQTITVNDTEAPAIACPGNKNLNGCTTTIGSYITAAIVDDNCGSGGVTVTQTPGANTTIASGATVAVTLTATDASGNSSTCTFNVTRAAVPTITASGPTAFCSGGSVTLTASQGSSYLWKRAATSIGTTQSIVLTTAGSYTITVTDANGCAQTSAPINVVVNALPALVNASASPSTICPGTSTILTAGGTTGLTYVWTVAGVPVGTGSSISVTPTTTTTYTITGTNANGCSKTGTVTVTVNKVPIITCPSNILVNNATGQCGAIVTYPAVVVTGTPTPSVNYSVASGSFFQVGVTTVTVTANNSCGTATCSFTVTVKDNQPPVITCSPALTVNNDPGLCGAFITTSGGGGINNRGNGKGIQTTNSSARTGLVVPTVTDNCSVGAPVGVRNDGLPMSALFPIGTTVITWTVTDASGNTASCTQVITVIDNENPAINNLPGNISVSNSPNTCGATISWTPPTASDNCGVNLTSDHNPGETFPVGTTTVTYTATDIHGNSATSSFTVTVNDTQAPVLTGVPADVTVECDAVPVVPIVTATDNCTANMQVQYNQVQVVGMCPSSYVLTRTWTVSDAAGNTTSASQVISVHDTQAPVLSAAPANVTVECNAVPTAAVLTATDNCDAAPVVTFNEVHTNGTCPSSYTLIRMWTATDACGNSSSKTQVVTVQDTQAPVLSAAPANVTVECNAVPTAATLTATDNCDASPVVTFNEVRTNGSCPSSYILTRTWTATDACGNSSSKTQVVTVHDTQAPVLSAAPENVTVECNAVPAAATLTATDNCSAAPVVTFNEVRTNGSCPSSYTLTRTWTTTDACGNSSSKTQVVTVHDTQAPVLSAAPENVTVECNAVPAAATLTATDNCSAAPVVTFNEVRTNGSCPSSYTLTRTWTATDACGNSSSKTQVVTVHDTQAPVLSAAPENVTVECNAVPAAATLTATDNCSAAPVVTFNEVRTNGSCPSSYTLTRTWTATDACGNSSSKTQVVTVHDTQAPVLSAAPENVTVECNAVPTAATLTATDNCSAAPVVTFNEVRTNGTCPSSYILTRTWTATDACGNSSSKTQIVTVHDTQAPVLSAAPENVTVECNAVPAVATLTATDNCSAAPIVTFNEVRTNGSCPSSYTLTRTWTATDACGNSSSKTQIVTVHDTQAPVLSAAPENVTVECNAVPAAATLTATDNCSAAPVVTFNEVRTNGSCPSSYTLTRTWTTTDACGNSSSKTQVVTVHDTQAPVLSAAPENVTVECNAVPAAATLTATDNCSAAPVVTFNEVRTNGSCPSSYTLTRTWTTTDACGNSSSKTQVVTVHDTQAPVLSAAPENVTVECNAVPAAATLTATDNCSAAPVVTFNEVRTNGSCPSSYTLTRTWTATDACGNSSSKTQVVTVHDTQAPVLSAAPENVTVECNAVPTAATLTATDNCSAAPVVTFNEVRTNGSCPSSYTLTRTWTATDACGNSSSKTQVVTVHDTQAPVLSAAPANVTVECNSVPAAATLTATDNCTAAPVVTFNEVRTNGSCPSSYTLTRTWTATDACGNSSSKTQIVTVHDTQAPVLTTSSNISVMAATGQCGATVTYPAATATDNCGAATITYSKASGTLFTVGATTVTVTATDACGNQTVRTFNVTVTDSEKPLLTVPASITACDDLAGNNKTLTAQSSDNCGVQSITYTLTGATTGSGTGSGVQKNFNIGVTTITWTVTDNNGNIQTGSTTVTINPLPVPSITTTSTCNSVTLTAGSASSYQWKFNGSVVSTSQSLTLNNSSTDGVYSLYVTNSYGCLGGPANYTFSKSSLNGLYTIVGLNSVNLGNTNVVQTGSVGVTGASGTATFGANDTLTAAGAFVQSPAITVGSNSSIANKVYSASGYTLPAQQTYSSGYTGLSNYTVAMNATVTLSSNYAALYVSKGAIVTLTGSTFQSITIEEGARVTFTSTVLNMENLTVGNGNNSGFARVIFANNTAVRISTQMTVGAGSIVNQDNNSVSFYLGSTGTITDRLLVKGGAKVNGYFYAPNGNIHVQSACTTSTGTTSHTVNDNSYDITYNGWVLNPDGTYTFRFSVKNYWKYDISHVAFELCAGTTAISPTTTYNSTYSYSIDNGTNNPYRCIKFTPPSGNGYGNGAVDNFAYTVSASQFACMATIRVQSKASTLLGNATFNRDECNTTTTTCPTTYMTGLFAGKQVNSDLNTIWNGGTSCPSAPSADTVKPVIACPGTQTFCQSTNPVYTIPAATATDNSGSVTVSYAITGAAVRSGTGGDASGVFSVGTATIVYTATDASGNSSTCTTTVVIAPIQVPTFTSTSTCNSVTLTSVAASSYQWKFNGNVISTSQSLTLNNSSTDGVYSLYVTNSYGCLGGPANYTFSKSSLNGLYTIVGLNSVNLGNTNVVQTGSVGVTGSTGTATFGTNDTLIAAGAFVQSPAITAGSNSSIPNKVLSAAGYTLPAQQTYSGGYTGLSNYTVAMNATVTLSSNYAALYISKGAVVTLTGSTFQSITIEEGARVTFTSTVLNMENLAIGNGNNSGFARVIFANNTAVRISTQMTVGAGSIVNQENNSVSFYLGSAGTITDRLLVKGGAKVNGYYYSPNGNIHVQNTCSTTTGTTSHTLSDNNCDVTYNGYVHNSDDTYSCNFSVKNKTSYDVNHVAFELCSGTTAISPTCNNYSYYNYSIYNGTTSTPYPCLKYVPGYSGYSNNATDNFTYKLTASQFSCLSSIRVQCKASTAVCNQTFNRDECNTITTTCPTTYMTGLFVGKQVNSDLNTIWNGGTSCPSTPSADTAKPVITCPGTQTFCQATSSTYTIPACTATDNSGSATITYVTTGATVRSGSGGNATGLFNVGTTSVTFTATDASGNSSSCTSTVKVNPLPTPSISATTSGNTITLIGSSSPAANSYVWQLNGTQVSTAPSVSFAGNSTVGNFNPTGSASNFNVFIKNSVTAIGGDTHGPVAMGGNLNLNGNTIFTMNNSGTYPTGTSNHTDNYGMVIGGSLIYSSGNQTYVNRGVLRVGSSSGSNFWYTDNNNAATNLKCTPSSYGYNSTPCLQLQRQQPSGTVTSSHGIDFNGAFTDFNDCNNRVNNWNNSSSTSLNKITIPSSSNPHITLVSGKINYINLTTTQLTALNSQGSIIFDNTPAADRVLVINVTCSSTFNWIPPNFGGVSEANGAYILWNFFGTCNLNINGSNPVFGSIYAPNCNVADNDANNINGQIIGSSLSCSTGEIHYYPFSCNLPDISTSQTKVYSLYVTDVNGCTNTTAATYSYGYTSSSRIDNNGNNSVKDIVKTDDSHITVVSVAATVLAYPNPGKGQFILEINGFDAATALVSISDSYGKTVLTRSVALNSKSATAAFDLQNIAAGIYNISVTDGKLVKYTRLVVAR